MHWSKVKSELATWMTLIRSQTKLKGLGPVKIKIVRYNTGMAMDIDNLYSTAKIPLDALRKTGVIIDDDPSMVTDLRVEWKKVNRKKEARTVIYITHYGTPNKKNRSSKPKRGSGA